MAKEVEVGRWALGSYRKYEEDDLQHFLSYLSFSPPFYRFSIFLITSPFRKEQS